MLWPNLLVVIAVGAFITSAVAQETNQATVTEPSRIVSLAGDFNDWQPADPAWRMLPIGTNLFAITQFFRAGEHKFRILLNEKWENYYGATPAGRLVQPGSEIVLKIRFAGGYTVWVDFDEKSWRFEPADLIEPHALLVARPPLEVNVPIVLDASDSLPRAGSAIRAYQFAASTNNPARIPIQHRSPDDPTATVVLPREGVYEFFVRIDDGMDSAPESVRFKADRSYQLVGEWTDSSPTNPVTFMTNKGEGIYEKVLVAPQPGDSQVLVMRNHDPSDMVDYATLSVTATNRQLWLARYDEVERKFSCAPAQISEFIFNPADYPVLENKATRIKKVHLVGSFNNWNKTDSPLVLQADGTYVGYRQLEDGHHLYKFLVNDDIWLPDARTDPALGRPDGHGGLNAGIYVGEMGKDYGKALTNHVNLAAVRHQPKDSRYFNKVMSNLAEISLRTLQGDVANVALMIEGRPPIRMSRADRDFGFEYWKTTVFTSPGEAVQYQFVLTDGKAREVLGGGSNTTAFVADAEVRFPTPDWAKHVVWYQIFPERFRNGDPRNDPPHTLPWKWDWYKFAAGEAPNDQRNFSSAWYGRRFGGDIQGMIKMLPYFKELGVTALYLCPIFEANSYHGYDTIDYRHVASAFGTKDDNAAVIAQETLDPSTWQWTPSDKLFLEFIEQAHARGLKVIVDGVFNHMGKGSFALQDVLTNGMNSAYADWFDIIDWGPPVQYKSWDGSGWMPNFRKDHRHGIESASARQYLSDVTRRWMDPNGDGDPSDGIDGWRLDVAPDIPSAFWISWRQFVKKINPDAYINGEHWGVATSFLQGDQWDAVMNYQFAVRAIRFFIDQQRKLTPTMLDRELQDLLNTYPLQVNFAMQNLYDSHDTERLVNMVINPDRDYDQGNRPQDGHVYKAAKPGAEAYAVQKLMATFQMTFLGAPMIWYGDEVGMYGADDPTNRKPMLWRDLMPYQNPNDVIKPDVFEHYRRLIAIRNTYLPLRVGLYKPWITDDAQNVFGFLRARNEDVVAVVLNNSDRPAMISAVSPFPARTQLIDVLRATPSELVQAPMAKLEIPGFGSDATVLSLRVGKGAGPVYTARDGKLHLSLPARSAMVLVPAN